MPDLAMAKVASPARESEPQPPLPTPARARRSPGERLRATLLELASGHGELRSQREKAWASITFAGTRHEITLLFEGDAGVQAGEHFIAELPDHEFTIPGQIVADATIAAVEHEMLPSHHLLVVCEVLMLEDG